LLSDPLPGTRVTFDLEGKAQTVDAHSPEELLRGLHRVLRPAPELARLKALEQLEAWASTRSRPIAGYRFLTEDELRRLSQSDLIEIGAHTKTHPVLSSLDAEEERTELTSSRNSLESLTGRLVTSVSFPYGQRADYTSRTLRTVQQAGFERACTAIPDVVWRQTPRFELPRLWVNNWTGEEFAHRLSGWLRD
jgi:peptidoglycan/xylan/chitin deacetylase (PgdA/CDA1 family)